MKKFVIKNQLLFFLIAAPSSSPCSLATVQPHALIHASMNGDRESVIILIGQGADVNAHDPNGNTPLIIATSEIHTGIVQLLLEKKANIHACNKQGKTALLWAATRGITAIVAQLLQAGATVNTKDKNGCTPTMLAALYGHADILQALIHAGADLTAISKRKATTLMYAASGGHTTSIDVLLKKQPIVGINAIDTDGDCALTLAIARGHSQIAFSLMHAGAKVNLINHHSHNALLLAYHLKDTKLIHELKQRGATYPPRSTVLKKIRKLLFSNGACTVQRDYPQNLS